MLWSPYFMFLCFFFSISFSKLRLSACHFTGWCPELIDSMVSRSVMSDSLPPRGLQPTRLLCLWDSPGKNTGVGCHFLLQGIFPTQGQTQVSHIAGRCFNLWATKEALTLNDTQIGHWINGYVNMVLLLLRKYNLTHLWNISCTHPTKYRNTCSFSVIIHTNVQVKNTACLPFHFSKFFPFLWVKFLPHSQSFSRPLLVYLIGT